MDLLSMLSSLPSQKSTNPREIFMSLPRKASDYAYPRDVQSEVWEKWYTNKDRKNTIIKMNTGSGKTVVGLMILQSSLNEDFGPAIYVVPDKYLIQQVLNEAESLGIKATSDRDNFSYTENKSILVTSIHSLVNGKSVFGMRDSNNYPIGTIIIDDVHACLDTIEKQFSVVISNDSNAYREIKKILANSLSEYDPHTASEIFEAQFPKTRMLVPFWIWQQNEKDIFSILQKHATDINSDIQFSLPLVRNCFSMCNCVITTKEIEISPIGNDVSLIKSFHNAKRRIFMSATLADDSVFVSALGLEETEIQNIITPNRANDIGSRLILFPKHLNNMISDDDIRKQVAIIAHKHNVVVIVPSFESAFLWKEYATITVSKENILEAVTQLKAGHVGLVVFVNRYDGIDLPYDACRMLIIDSLPPLNKEYTKYVHSICTESKLVVREQMQRIEQGMGRGVRSSTDACCVVLMGSNLADVLIRQKGYEYFSQATAKQYALSKQLWELLKGVNETPGIEDIFEIANYSLNQAPEWIQRCKANLADVTYSIEPQIDKTAIAIRMAFEEYLNKRINKAIECLDNVIRTLTDASVKGYLLQMKAAYINLYDPVKAQETLLSAKALNRSILNPIEGIQHNRITNAKEQVNNIIVYAKSICEDPNAFLIFVQKALDNLSFEADSDSFESALETIGRLLGFVSSRPDRETRGEGPDNLWALGNGKYWVIECKNEARTEEISKDYCNQLGGSIRWFQANYPREYNPTPILVHISSTISEKATPVDKMRIINEQSLNRLRDHILRFYTALISLSDWNDEAHIRSLLNKFELNAGSLEKNITVGYR